MFCGKKQPKGVVNTRTSKGTSVTARVVKFMMEYSDPSLRETFVEGMRFTDEMVKAVKDTLAAHDMVFIEKQLEFTVKKISTIKRFLMAIDEQNIRIQNMPRMKSLPNPFSLYARKKTGAM